MDTKTRRRHLDAQQCSGKSIPSYCADHNLNRYTFYKWRQEFRRQPILQTLDSQKQGGATFKEIILPTPPRMHRPSEYRISTTGNGFTLTIPNGFDVEEVKDLLSIMSAREA
jgi:hypothetical protein